MRAIIGNCEKGKRLKSLSWLATKYDEHFFNNLFSMTMAPSNLQRDRTEKCLVIELKGHIFSKCLFGVIVSTKKPPKFF